jgi:hypothetical protein
MGLVAGGSQNASAQTDMSRFPLTKAFPADAFIAVAARSNPERKFLDDHWARVSKAFMQSGICGDVWDMVIDAMNDENADKAEDLREKFTKLTGEVQWCKLFDQEMIYAGRFIAPSPASPVPFEGVLLGRLSAAEAQTNYKGLKTVIEEVVKLFESEGAEGIVTSNETKEGDISIVRLTPTGLPTVGICVASWKDIVAISYGGTSIIEECVKLLKDEGKGLTSSPKFKAAFAKLPPAEDSLVFFDPSIMLEKMGGFMNMGRQMAARERSGEKKTKKKSKTVTRRRSGDDDDADADEDDASTTDKGDAKSKGGEDSEENEDAAMMNMVHKLLAEMMVFDYIAEVEWTDGLKVYSSEHVAIKPGAEDRPVIKFLSSGKPVGDFARFVPKEAGDFSVSSGMNFSKLYHSVRDFVADNVPGGGETIEEFDTLQKEQWKLDIDKDILSLFDGGMIHVSMGNDWVMMLRVTDAAKASEQVSALFEKLNEALGEENTLTMTPVKVLGKSFTQVTHPMFMMMGGFAPIWGCAEDHLIIGTSAKAVTTCLKTARGEHPNITKSKRFVDEALAPKGSSICGVSFTDESKMAAELQQVIGALSMALGFATMGMQDAPPQVKAIIGALPQMLAKLGPVVGKMDFFQSSAEYSTFDGKGWLTHRVQNYKPPRPPEPDSAKGDEDPVEDDGGSDAADDQDSDEERGDE